MSLFKPVKQFFSFILSNKKLVAKVFFFGFMIDITYVVWMKAVSTGNPFLAGGASVLVSLPSLLGYLEIMENKRLIPHYLFGLFCGTVAGILFLS